jgi:hypothetical protein
MIDKLSLADTRPGILIDKINEVIDAVNNIVKYGESSASAMNPENPSDPAPKIAAGGDDPRD